MTDPQPHGSATPPDSLANMADRAHTPGSASLPPAPDMDSASEHAEQLNPDDNGDMPTTTMAMAERSNELTKTAHADAAAHAANTRRSFEQIMIHARLAETPLSIADFIMTDAPDQHGISGLLGICMIPRHTE